MSATTRSPDPAAATPAVTQIAQAFKSVAAAHRRLRGRERRHPGDLRDAQYALLFWLHQEPDPMSLRDLADRAELSGAAATEMLDGLVEAGLVLRARSETDRRVVLHSITDQGHTVVAERRARFEPRWQAAFAEFSEEELRATVAVLTRMRQFFEELAEEG